MACDADMIYVHCRECMDVFQGEAVGVVETLVWASYVSTVQSLVPCICLSLCGLRNLRSRSWEVCTSFCGGMEVMTDNGEEAWMYFFRRSCGQPLENECVILR